MQRLTGKIALVTGAARGIGQGIALCLAEEGADVLVNDLPAASFAGQPDANDTVQQIERLGRRALAHAADVSDRAQVAAMFAAAAQQFGRIDIVVANAAMSIREPTLSAEWNHVQRTIEVAQFGVYHTCQAAARQMVAQGGGGKIIIIGSVLADMPMPHSAPYNMAKAAINHLARTLAIELAEHRINVNVINPGFIDTPGERAFASEAQIAELGASLPWGRAGTPHDIGRAVAFLASDDADYITGSALVVDGGFRLRMP
ncbi:MAG TPA: SDR family oxidoreductase [Kouleothrix sp.]|nr:SDR family oxidoreductase [Kouleothrix sp.]